MTATGRAAVILVLGVAILGGVGGCPGRQAAQDEQRTREIVRDELRTGQTQAVIEQMTQEAGVQPLVQEALESPAMQTRIARMIENQLTAPDLQARLSDQIRDLLGTPEVQAALQDAVRQQLMQIIGGGGGGGGQ
ncbi:MAG: hypothetical protein RDU89_04155 [bacterium]|nr:hypothetical protein [bacterium]